MFYFEPIYQCHSVQANQFFLVKRSGRSQNWLADYVAKANNGGIERVLL